MAVNQSITIYLADDHEIVATAIAGLLRSLKHVDTVKTFTSGKSLYNACLSKSPDLVILDLEMPEWSGLDTLEKIRALGGMPVMLLTMNDEKTVIEEAFKKGAQGYLHKNCTAGELETAITTVMSGNLFLSEDIKKIMVGIRQSAPSSVTGLSEPITDKEFEVLQLICEGLSSKEIGEKLFLSPRTVETRKQSLMDKFNVRTTGKLIASAIKNKIVK